MIMVCGATGTIGSRVVKELAKSGARIRALVRKRKEQGNAEQVEGDLGKPETLGPALEGVEAVFLLSAVSPSQLEQEQNLIAAAVAKKTPRIVKLSAMGAAPDAPFEFARMHGKAESVIRASGLAWTFIRPNMYMQNLRWYKDAIAQGMLPLSLGDAAVSHVDADDVAAVAAQALLSDRHAQKTYTATGPEALTGGQLASTLSKVLGKNVAYAPVSLDDFRKFLQGSGEPKPVVDAECELFDHWSRSEGAMVTRDVESVLGRKPVDFESFARRSRGELAGS